MNQGFLWVLLAYGIYSFITLCGCFIHISMDLNGDVSEFYSITPSRLYYHTNYNWFGAIFIWVFYLIFLPMRYVAVLLWLVFHAGRK